MIKLLLLLAVVLGAVWWLRGLGRGHKAAVPPAAQRPGAGQGPSAMLACAHCGVHLPQPEALFDVGGRPYCSDAHRLAGPVA